MGVVVCVVDINLDEKWDASQIKVGAKGVLTSGDGPCIRESGQWTAGYLRGG